MSYAQRHIANELLSHFGRNTAIEVDHHESQNIMQVLVTRSKGMLATIEVLDNGRYMMNECGYLSLEAVAHEVQNMRRFPKPRKMNKAWSPIRLTDSAKAELDIRRATMNGYFEDASE